MKIKVVKIKACVAQEEPSKLSGVAAQRNIGLRLLSNEEIGKTQEFLRRIQRVSLNGINP